ncbi:MAG: orotate phosphoribosyltransferase [Thermosediminibacterales bacterium]|nr:orotate phosphoribosyltransferase [Thermosediminibacterales bacterium]
MDSREILDVFKKTGGILEGHFLLTSGRHSGKYLQCALVTQYPEYTEMLCKKLADLFKHKKIDVVIGPATGGILISYETARHLGTRTLFTERENGVMKLRRGFSIKPGENVLVVEDVVTTGGSVKEVIDLVKAQKGNIAGVGLFVDRSGGKVDFGVETKALLSLEIESYPPDECPICRKNIPLVKPGSRRINL